MVNCIPFKGLRFNKKIVGDISTVIAPPYDIVSQEQKNFLRGLSPYNLINLTLPDDTKDMNKYQNAAEILSHWINKEVLIHDDTESFYVFEEEFKIDGIIKSFTGFIGLLQIENYGSKNGILRHEKTLSKPKEDRLNLLRNCRTNFECIYTLFSDDSNKISDVISSVKENKKEIIIDAPYDPSLKFNLWKMTDMKQKQTLTDLMKNKTLLIADGHHRYETSRLYREEARGECQYAPEDFIMTLFVSSNQPNIMIHPTHRLIKFEKKLYVEELIKKISAFFNIKKIEFSEQSIIKNMDGFSRKTDERAVCICNHLNECYIASLCCGLEEAYKKLNVINTREPFIKDFEYLDVNILHEFILSTILKEFEVKEITFLHTVNEVIEKLGSYKTDHLSCDIDKTADEKITDLFGFILNPPSIKTVESLSDKGLIMPQKSTYFYPKPCSGLVIYKF